MTEASIKQASLDDLYHTLYGSVDGAFIALHEPRFGSEDKIALANCIDSGFVSSAGQQITEFENAIANFTGAKHAVAVANGTAALHLALIASGVQENEEVLVPAITFVATANACLYSKAIPHFIDVDYPSCQINISKLETYLVQNTEIVSDTCRNKMTGRVIKAIIVMHCFGHIENMEKITSLANRYKLTVIEDAAAALGSSYNGQQAGTFGTCGIFSFNGNKIITTGGGGMLVTDQACIAKRAKHLSTVSKQAHPWAFQHDMMGYNYRMPNLNAALGLAQLLKLPNYLAQKKILFNYYREKLYQQGILSMIEPVQNCVSNHWLFAATVSTSAQLGITLDFFAKKNIMARPLWEPMPTLTYLRDYPSMDISGAIEARAKTICLPSSPYLAQQLTNE